MTGQPPFEGTKYPFYGKGTRLVLGPLAPERALTSYEKCRATKKHPFVFPFGGLSRPERASFERAQALRDGVDATGVPNHGHQAHLEGVFALSVPKMGHREHSICMRGDAYRPCFSLDVKPGREFA